MAEVNSFARFFGATYPAESQVADGVIYGDPTNDFEGSATGVTPSYPAESEVLENVEFGNEGDPPFVGTLNINTEANLPAESDVLVTITYGSDPVLTGQWRPVSPADARLGLSYGPAGTPVIGSLDIDAEDNHPDETEVKLDVVYGVDNQYTGELDPGAAGTMPSPTNVRFGIPVAETTGLAHIPTADQVLAGVEVDQTIGTVTLPAEIVTLVGISYGANGALEGRWHTADADKYLVNEQYGVDGTSRTGTLQPSGEGIIPSPDDVRLGIAVGLGFGNARFPFDYDVRKDIAYDSNDSVVGTLEVNSGGPTEDPDYGDLTINIDRGDTETIVLNVPEFGWPVLTEIDSVKMGLVGAGGSFEFPGVVDVENERITITLEPDDTALLRGTFRMDLQGDVGAAVYTLAKGSLNVRETQTDTPDNDPLLPGWIG